MLFVHVRSTDKCLITEASKLNLDIAEAPGSRRGVSGGTHEGVVYEITRSRVSVPLPVASV